MSESQGTSTSTQLRAKSAALSRHWKVAVLAAAGFATMAGTTTVVGIADAGAAEAKPASVARDSSKARPNPGTVDSARDSEGADDGDGDYWAGLAGNPNGDNAGTEGDGHSGSQDKEINGSKGADGSNEANGAEKADGNKQANGAEKADGNKQANGDKQKDSGSKSDGGAEKGSGSKSDEGAEKKSEGYDQEKGSGGQDGYGDDQGSGSYEGEDGKVTDVECDPDHLISAIVQANELEGPSHLRLAEKCTYTLTATEDGNGLPKITQPITIDGNDATIARAANATQFRIFEVGSGGDLKLRNLTITRGKTNDDDGGGINVNAAGRLDLDSVTLENNTVSDLENYDGGAIYNEGITTVRDSTLDKNSAEDGSTIYNSYGKLEITNTKVTGSISDNDDGYAAIYNDGGTTKIKKSYLAYNYGYSGGALYNSSGVSEVEKSTIAHNYAYYGGGIYSGDSLYVRDSTIKNNTAVDGGGGGINAYDFAVIEDSKITDNAATLSNGGGIYVDAFNEVAIRDSKVAGNRAPGNGFSGGGIFTNIFSTLTLTDSKVKDNTSDEPAGGIENRGTVVTKGKVKIIDNVPTNCDSPTSNPVPSCFG
ncbi:hypothetical protein ACWGI8_43435 [Streptomyces sp. NPDC054841]